MIAAVVLIAISSRGSQAAAQDFVIASLDCTGPPGHIRVTKVGAADATIGDLRVRVTPPGGAPSGLLSVTSAVGGPTANVDPGATLDLQVGPGATTRLTNPGGPLTNGDTVALSSAPLLQPGVLVQLYNGTTAIPGDTATCPATGFSRTLTVSIGGEDVVNQDPTQPPNTICGPDLPTDVIATPTLPGPCLTIAHALQYARDGDTILVENGIFEICSTIEVTKLVTITAGSGVGPSNPVNKVVLHSFTGTTIFHVTAVGAPVGPGGLAQHASINGFNIGGAYQPAAAAIYLDNDAYTDVTNNVLGGDPLVSNPLFTSNPCVAPPAGAPAPAPPPTEIFGNAASIILGNSDHPNIANNSILGTAIFQFSPVLAVGSVLTGFGIVTSECLGLGTDASDGVTIASNLIDRNTNAAIWMCSDGGGLHQIKSNTVRNNGRGMVLRAIADSTLDSNTISNDYQDGIVIYDAASNNTISNDIIESHHTPGSAGIRLGDFGGGLYPLATVLTNNRLLRNWIGIDIAGARNTVGTGNTFTAEDIRTAILVQVGSQGATAFTQPTGTAFHQNQIIYNGSCAASQGCAIRLDSFVTVNVDATGNSFGLSPDADVNTVLWHKANDPSLGLICAGQTGLAPGSCGPAAPAAASPTATPSPTPGPSATATAGPTASATPTATR